MIIDKIKKIKIVNIEIKKETLFYPWNTAHVYTFDN